MVNAERRKFLGGMGGAAALAAGGGVFALPPVLGMQGATALADGLVPVGGEARVAAAEAVRIQAANAEAQLGAVTHVSNGDEALYANRIGNFHKTLPHDAIGEVDSAAYNSLLSALESGEFAALEAVPAGQPTARFVDPLGPLAYNLDGPDNAAVTMFRTPFALAGAEKAAEAVEHYWQAYLRDVPFADYPVNPVVQQACDELSAIPEYLGPRDETGKVTPQLLFRYDFPGALDGPMTSQFLYWQFFFDSMVVNPQIRPLVPVLLWETNGTFRFNRTGRDFLTSFDEWLLFQNGGDNRVNGNVFDRTNRYIRSMRDLGHLSGGDVIITPYLRAALMLEGTVKAEVDDGNPMKSSRRINPFGIFGRGHLYSLLGRVHQAERHAFYQKWHVHRHLRPEAYGGLVDNHMQGRASYPIHSRLLDSNVLDKIAAFNRDLNNQRFGTTETTYLLPQAFPGGCPEHPSSPAGHSFNAGTCVTFLKAWFKEDWEIPAGRLVKPNRDGTALEPYVIGVDGPPLTVGGELNKLAHNLTEGRAMAGVHWRESDNRLGLYLGEEVAIRLLQEAKATYPVEGSFTLTKFDGTTIVI